MLNTRKLLKNIFKKEYYNDEFFNMDYDNGHNEGFDQKREEINAKREARLNEIQNMNFETLDTKSVIEACDEHMKLTAIEIKVQTHIPFNEDRLHIIGIDRYGNKIEDNDPTGPYCPISFDAQ